MNKKDPKAQRNTRIRRKIANVSLRPRLAVFRSNRYCYAQIIDISGKTLLGLSEKVLVAEKKGATPIERARHLGVSVAKMAIDKKIKEVVFDKGSFAYHGRVRAIAEGAREGGLNF
jgi:large subunit ribosomal protein L18